jgi:hypothetical protein
MLLRTRFPGAQTMSTPHRSALARQLLSCFIRGRDAPAALQLRMAIGAR